MRLRRADIPRFTALAGELRAVLRARTSGDTDNAAQRLNTLLAAHPHLALEEGVWRITATPWTPLWSHVGRLLRRSHGPNDRRRPCRPLRPV